jgi:hypothetical protein
MKSILLLSLLIFTVGCAARNVLLEESLAQTEGLNIVNNNILENDSKEVNHDSSLAVEREKIENLAVRSNLSVFSVRACVSADESKTCYKLESLGLVSEEECCSSLSKCCK